ncbi:Premnaspirodiene oxygenase [Acorus calamus]|uniref:Premnaspirodiene oxygenase n=2 Tax=Acorus calamus TaxID=4465 RepID=A0AAV9F639_ACOCL|nr:Premnaspirodiene oxygenase [Acorus calamus]
MESNNLLFLILLISIPLFLLKRSLTKKPNLPPSPLKLPIIGHLHLIGPSPHQSLHDLSKKYGPLMHLQLGQVPTLIVSSPKYAQEILKTQDKICASRPALKVPQLMIYGTRDIAFAPYGEFWRHVRKITTLHLLSSKRVQSFRRVRDETVAHMIQNIRNAVGSPSGLVNLSDILYAFTTSVIARVTFGKEFLRPGVIERIHGLVQVNSKLLGGLHLEDCFPGQKWLDLFTGLSGRVEKNFHGWDSLFDESIEDHMRTDGDKGESDFVDVLLALQKEENTKDVFLSKEDIKGILQDMFGAGTDTTYILLEWTMAELVKNPNVMKKAKEEIIEIMKEKSSIDEDDLGQMKYLRAIIKEVLRLHPPVPLAIPRELMEDTTIKNYNIPAGTRIFLNIWSIGKDTEYWESPELFKPERFIDSPLDFKGNDFQFIPFGSGRRICPGMQFAIIDVELALANLIYHFEWKLPSGLEEDMDMTEAPGITTPKKSKLVLVATPSQSTKPLN